MIIATFVQVLQLQVMLRLENCWIGLGAKIIQNCIIGDNVFVAAGAVITKNVKSNSFVKGIPAKYAKKLAKFDNNLIQKVNKVIKSEKLIIQLDILEVNLILFF